MISNARIEKAIFLGGWMKSVAAQIPENSDKTSSLIRRPFDPRTELLPESAGFVEVIS
jgi:hypothetical protein